MFEPLASSWGIAVGIWPLATIGTLGPANWAQSAPGISKNKRLAASCINLCVIAPFSIYGTTIVSPGLRVTLFWRFLPLMAALYLKGSLTRAPSAIGRNT